MCHFTFYILHFISTTNLISPKMSLMTFLHSHDDLYFKLDIILVKGLSKHRPTLNTHAFLLTFRHVLSKICPYDQKHTRFTPILQVFAPLNDVRAYIAWSWKTILTTWRFFFPRGWHPTSNTSASPPRVLWSPLAWDVTQHMSMSAFGVISTLLLHTMCALSPLFYTSSEAPTSI